MKNNEVICIDNEGLDDRLTLYKIYTIVESLSHPLITGLMVNDDQDQIGLYSIDRFVDIQEWRDKQIEKLSR